MSVSYNCYPMCGLSYLASFTWHIVCDTFVFVNTSFLVRLRNIPNNLFIRSSLDVHLYCFYPLTIVNRTALHICVQVFT